MLTPLLLYDLGKAMDATSRCPLLVDFFPHFWCQVSTVSFSKLNHTRQRKQSLNLAKSAWLIVCFVSPLALNQKIMVYEAEVWEVEYSLCTHFVFVYLHVSLWVERLDMMPGACFSSGKVFLGGHIVTLMSIFSSIHIPWYLMPLPSLASGSG